MVVVESSAEWVAAAMATQAPGWGVTPTTRHLDIIVCKSCRESLKAAESLEEAGGSEADLEEALRLSAALAAAGAESDLLDDTELQEVMALSAAEAASAPPARSGDETDPQVASALSAAASSAPSAAGGVPLMTDQQTFGLVECDRPAVIEGSVRAAFAQAVQSHRPIWDCTPPMVVAGTIFWWHPTREVWLCFDEIADDWRLVE